MQEIDQLIKATTEVGSVSEARKVLGWSKRKLKHITKEYQFPGDYGRRLMSEVGTATSDLLAKNLQQFVKKAMPGDLHEKHKLASHYAKENDLIGDIVKTKAFLGNYGFNILAEKEKEEKAISDFNEKYNVMSITRQMWYMAMAHDNLAVTWKNEGKKLKHLLVLDPKYLWIVQKIEKVGDDWMQVYDDGIPQKEVYSQQDDNLVTVLQNLRKLDPKSVTELPASSTEWNLWDEEEQGRVEVRTYNGYIDRMVEPTVQQVFFDLALRQMVKDGNMATFYHLKRIIWLIKIGAIKGDRDVPLFLRTLGKLTQKEADEWLTKFKDIEKSLMAVVPADQEHEFIAPPIEYLKLENFQAVDWPIIRWSDIGPLLGYPQAKGGAYAGDYLKLKKGFATIQQWRGIIGDLWITIYRDILGVKGKIDVMWNEFILLEPRVLLDRVKYLEQEAGLSPQTAQKVLGFNPDMEKRLLAEAWEDPMKYVPVYESKQGILTGIYEQKGLLIENKNGDGEPGRPTTDGPQSDEDQKGQQPRPSQAILLETEMDKSLIDIVGFDDARGIIEIEADVGDDFDPILEPMTAPYEGEKFFHVESTKKHSWAKDPRWVSKKLKNGIVLRLCETTEGKMAVRVYLLPKSKFESLKEAKAWVKSHEK